MVSRKKIFVKRIVDVGDEIEPEDALTADLPFSTKRDSPGHDGLSIEDHVMRCGTSVPVPSDMPLYRIIPPSLIGR